MCRGEIWDAEKYEEKDGDIIETYPNGRDRVRVKAVPAVKTPVFMKELAERWEQCLFERWVHPLRTGMDLGIAGRSKKVG